MKKYNHFVFPSLITEIECNLYKYIKNDLVDWIYNFQSKSESVVRSNRGGWQSHPEFHIIQSFSEFKNYILNNCFQSLNHYSCNFELGNMWININKKGNYNCSHVHPGSTISGVFWVKTPENCGELIFESPNDFLESNLINLTDNSIKSQYNYFSEMIFVPQEGKMLLFPSHLFHRVEPSQSDEDRISIAFNLNIK